MLKTIITLTVKLPLSLVKLKEKIVFETKREQFLLPLYSSYGITVNEQFRLSVKVKIQTNKLKVH
jgi:protease II